MGRCLVGNTEDEEERVVTEEEGRALGEKHGLSFVEVSTLRRTNVKEAVERVVQDIADALNPAEAETAPSKSKESKPRCTVQ